MAEQVEQVGDREVEPSLVLTQVPDVDRQILLRTPYAIVRPFCLTSRYALTLCDRTFWRHKFARDYVEIGLSERLVNYAQIYRDVVRIEEETEDIEERLIKLFVYALSHHYDRLAIWIAEGEMVKQIGVRYVDYQTFLSNAVRYDRVDVVRYLLDNSGSIERYLYDAAAVAVRNGSIETFAVLLDQLDDNDLLTIYLRTAEYDRLEMMRLIEEEREIEQQVVDDAYLTAANHSAISVLRYLLDSGAVEHSEVNIDQLVHSIARIRYTTSNELTELTDYVLSLLDSTGDRASPLGIFLRIALIYSNDTLAKQFLERLPKVTIEESLPTLWAPIVERDQIDIVRYLVEERQIEIRLTREMIDELLNNRANHISIYLVKRNLILYNLVPYITKGTIRQQNVQLLQLLIDNNLVKLTIDELVDLADKYDAINVLVYLYAKRDAQIDPEKLIKRGFEKIDPVIDLLTSERGQGLRYYNHPDELMDLVDRPSHPRDVDRSTMILDTIKRSLRYFKLYGDPYYDDPDDWN